MVQYPPESSPRIPLAKPEIIDADRQAVAEVLQTTSLSMDRTMPELEQAMAGYLSSPFAVVVNSGTSALHLALRCLNIPRGAEVVIPSFSFSAVLNVLLQEELQPAFAELAWALKPGRRWSLGMFRALPCIKPQGTGDTETSTGQLYPGRHVTFVLYLHPLDLGLTLRQR